MVNLCSYERFLQIFETATIVLRDRCRFKLRLFWLVSRVSLLFRKRHFLFRGQWHLPAPCFCFGINADYWLCVALPQMHPIVGEIDFYAIDGCDFLICIFLFDGIEDGIDVDVGCQLYFVLGNFILRIFFFNSLTFFAFVGKQRKEQKLLRRAHRGHNGLQGRSLLRCLHRQ